MADNTHLLLRSNLKQLRLPTMGAEFEKLAREAAESFSDGRHRWVVGSIGPGTKLPSLGNIAYDPLQAALEEQCRGLIAGGVLLIAARRRKAIVPPSPLSDEERRRLDALLDETKERP